MFYSLTSCTYNAKWWLISSCKHTNILSYLQHCLMYMHKGKINTNCLHLHQLLGQILMDTKRTKHGAHKSRPSPQKYNLHNGSLADLVSYLPTLTAQFIEVWTIGKGSVLFYGALEWYDVPHSVCVCILGQFIPQPGSEPLFSLYIYWQLAVLPDHLPPTIADIMEYLQVYRGLCLMYSRLLWTPDGMISRDKTPAICPYIYIRAMYILMIKNKIYMIGWQARVTGRTVARIHHPARVTLPTSILICCFQTCYKA